MSANDDTTPPDLDAWRAEAGACAPLDAAASPGPWFFDSYSSVHSEPLTREHSRIEATIPDDAADDDPAWATLPETLVCRVPCIAGDTSTAQGRADGAWVAAARTGWPRDAARVARLADRCEALQAALSEALDEFEDAIQYKLEYLVTKHGDRETLARLRVLAVGSAPPKGESR